MEKLSEDTALSKPQVFATCQRLVKDFKKVRNRKGISLRGLESISGIHSQHIARMESGRVIPNLKTIIRLLEPMGKTLYIGNIKSDIQCEEEEAPSAQLSIF